MPSDEQRSDAEMIAELRGNRSPIDSDGLFQLADRLEARNAEVQELKRKLNSKTFCCDGHDAEVQEQAELILDLFAQGCLMPSGKYSHGFISAYESAQKWLLDRGLIRAADCDYKS